jgi:Peptidase C39 family
VSRGAAATVRLAVPVFGQRDAECGNTSLKAVLRFLGVRASAARLAELAGASADGIEHAGLVRAVRRLGLASFERAGGSLRELRGFLQLGLPAIVGWWSLAPGEQHFDERWTLAQRRARDCGHFSVLCGLDAARVQLMDPQWQLRAGRWRVVGRRWLPRAHFDKLWYDTDTPRFGRVERWYLVVHDGARRFAAELGAGVDHPATSRRRRLR